MRALAVAVLAFECEMGVAPSNATPWYQSCTAKALGSGAASIALDSIAFIPGGKEIEIEAETTARQISNLKGYRGIVPNNYGRGFLTSSGRVAHI